MEISAARVASFHYTLTDDEGRVIDQSSEGRPLQYFHGAGNIIPGLERALAGKRAGDALRVDVRPEEGYGVRNENLVQVLPASAFQGVEQVQPGMQFQASNGDGTLLVTVVEVKDDQVRIDGNHPLAGQTLHFDVKVVEVRESTDEERQAGRVAQG